MKTKTAGAVIATLGLLSLSWQCYFLPVMSFMEFAAMGQAYDPTDVTSRPMVLLAMLLSLAVVILGICLLRRKTAPEG